MATTEESWNGRTAADRIGIRYLRNGNLTDTDVEACGWPAVFDHTTFLNGDRASESEAKKRLYDPRIFGLTNSDPFDATCDRCGRGRDDCTGHHAIIRLREEFRYIIPEYFPALAKMYKKNCNAKERAAGSNDPAAFYQSVVAFFREKASSEELASKTSVLVVVLPLCARMDYMFETRFATRKHCQYSVVVSLLCAGNVRGFYRQLEKMNSVKNKNIPVWDTSQPKSFKRLAVKPSCNDVLSGKNGFVRKTCLGGRIDVTSRQVAIPDGSLEIDELGVSAETYEKLSRHVPEQTCDDDDEPDCKGAQLSLVLCRQPTLYNSNTLKMRLKELEDLDANVHAYSPEICAASNLDFDGDETVAYAHTAFAADSILATLPSIMRADLGNKIVRGSYNVVCCVYMLTKWSHVVLPDVLRSELVRIARERRCRRFDRLRTRKDLMEKIVAVLMGREGVSIVGYVNRGELLPRAWRKSDWEAVQLAAQSLRRGAESDFLRDFKTCTKFMNAFVYFHGDRLTVNCRNFRRAHGLAVSRTDESDFETLKNECAQHWFDEESGERIIIDSGCNGTLTHLVQGVCKVGDIGVHYFINDFVTLCRLLEVPTKRINNTLVTAHIRRSYYAGLTDAEVYVAAVAGREGLVTSVVNTPDGGYGRRKTAFVASGLIVDNDCCVREGGTQFDEWFPPLMNVAAYDHYLDVKLSDAFDLPVSVNAEECGVDFAPLFMKYDEGTLVRTRKGHLILLVD